MTLLQVQTMYLDFVYVKNDLKYSLEYRYPAHKKIMIKIYLSTNQNFSDVFHSDLINSYIPYAKYHF